MKLSDQTRIKELAEQYSKAVRAMRALNEHAGEVRFGFGAEAMLSGADPHKVAVTADDPEYNQLLMILRQIARRRVADIGGELRELGVDPNA